MDGLHTNESTLAQQWNLEEKLAFNENFIDEARERLRTALGSALGVSVKTFADHLLWQASKSWP